VKRVGDYELLEELGRGAMGSVRRARDPQGRVVAIKLLTGRASDDERARRRFRREFDALRRLDHPGVVRVLDAGEAGHVPYLVLELVEGRSLDSRLLTTGALPIGEAVRLAAEVAEALQHAHERGVLHRDVKPANVLIDEAGHARLTDFGLTRLVDRELSGSRLSVTGAMMGTPGYWAPEQAQGDLERVGPHSDVYMLGATLYALLTGEPPHGAPETLIAALKATMKPVAAPSTLRPGLDRRLDAIVLRALARSPEERYATARELAEALDDWGASSATTGAGDPSRRATTVAAVLLVLGGGLVAAVTVLARAPARAPTAASPSEPPPTGGEPAADDPPAAVDPAAHSAAEQACREGDALREQGRMSEALAAHHRAVELDPDFARARVHRATFLRAAGDVEAALADLDHVLARDPDVVAAWINRAAVLEQAGRLGEALQSLLEGARLAPDMVQAHKNLAAFHQRQGQLREALASYDRVLELEPDFAPSWLGRATVLFGLGEVAAAERDVNHSLALDDASPQAHQLRGNIHDTRGDQAAALAAYQRQVVLDPTDPAGLTNVGATLRALGRAQEAIAPLREALRLDPGLTLAAINLALSHEALGDRPRGIEILGQALALDPAASGALQERGRMHQLAGDLPTAIADLSQAVDLQPNSARAHLALGMAYVANAQPELAIAEHRRALELDAGNVIAFNNLALLLHEGERFAEGLEVLERGLASHPDDPTLLIARATIEESLGLLEVSLATRRRVLQVAPRHPNARQVETNIRRLEALLAARGD
jgi:tetratricopeptide (TPR) repeat protein